VQHCSGLLTVAGVERSISKMGAALEQRGTEPTAHRKVRGLIEARESNAAIGKLTPQEACLLREIEFINAARARPSLGAQQLARGDESRRSPAAVGARQTASGNAGNAGEEGALAPHALLVTLRVLGSA